MYYVLYKNDELIGVSFNEPPTEFQSIGILATGVDALIPDLNNITFNTTEHIIVKNGSYSRLEFLSLLTPTERVNINASTDPVVIDIMNLFENADIINIHDQRTIQGMQYLNYIGILTPETYNKINGI